MSKIDEKRIKLAQKSANFGIFSTFLNFPEQPDFFVGSAAYRCQEESEPVILSYFLWHFVVG